MTSLRQMKMRVTTDDDKFPGMKKFKVHGKELKSLPKSLFNLLDLEILDLSPERETCLYFQLTMIPKEISQLALLKVSYYIIVNINVYLVQPVKPEHFVCIQVSVVINKFIKIIDFTPILLILGQKHL